MLKFCEQHLRHRSHPFLYLQDIGSKAILSSQFGICAVTCVSMMNTLIIILGRVINVVVCNMILPWTIFSLLIIIDDHILLRQLLRGVSARLVESRSLASCWSSWRRKLALKWRTLGLGFRTIVRLIKVWPEKNCRWSSFLWDMIPEFQNSIVQKDFTMSEGNFICNFHFKNQDLSNYIFIALTLGTRIIKIFIHNFSLSIIGAI